MEKWGYQISYKKALDGKHKAIRQLFGDFSQSYTQLPRLFLGIEQSNPGCAVVWKTCETNMPNTEIFNVCSGHSSHPLKGSNIVVPL